MQKAIVVLERIKTNNDFKRVISSQNPNDIVAWIEEQIHIEEELQNKSKKKTIEEEKISPVKKMQASFIEKLKMKMRVIEVRISFHFP